MSSTRGHLFFPTNTTKETPGIPAFSLKDVYRLHDDDKFFLPLDYPHAPRFVCSYFIGDLSTSLGVSYLRTDITHRIKRGSDGRIWLIFDFWCQFGKDEVRSEEDKERYSRPMARLTLEVPRAVAEANKVYFGKVKTGDGSTFIEVNFAFDRKYVGQQQILCAEERKYRTLERDDEELKDDTDCFICQKDR